MLQGVRLVHKAIQAKKVRNVHELPQVTVPQDLVSRLVKMQVVDDISLTELEDSK